MKKYVFHVGSGVRAAEVCDLPDDKTAIATAGEMARQVAVHTIAGQVHVWVTDETGDKIADVLATWPTLH